VGVAADVEAGRFPLGARGVLPPIAFEQGAQQLKPVIAWVRVDHGSTLQAGRRGSLNARS
jgi:hypothetical protein